MASIVRPSLLRQTCLAASKSSFPSRTSVPVRSTFVRNALPSTIRVAAFHASDKRSILPPGPQVIKGTVNDAAAIPPVNPSHGSYHWTFERLLSAGLVPLTIAPFAAGSLNPITDAALCGAILIHTHIGFEAVITDYVPKKRLPKTRKAFDWGLKLATVVVGVGLYEFETNDVGLTEAIRRIWVA